MDPQLVGAAGEGLEFQPAPEPTGFQQLPVGVGGFAGRVGSIEGRVAALAGQGQANAPRGLGRHAEHIGPVGLAHQPLGEQLAQGPVQVRLEGQEHQAGGVPIEPVHQLGRGPLLAQPGHQGIGQVGAPSRLAEQAGGFLCHQ